MRIVRLACLIHAASVRSEPESNSPYETFVDSHPVSRPDDILIVKTLQSQPTNRLALKGLSLIAQLNFQRALALLPKTIIKRPTFAPKIT